jgi:hypothetical protein
VVGGLGMGVGYAEVLYAGPDGVRQQQGALEIGLGQDAGEFLTAVAATMSEASSDTLSVLRRGV